MSKSRARRHSVLTFAPARDDHRRELRIGKALALSAAREGHPLLLISRHIEPIAGLPKPIPSTGRPMSAIMRRWQRRSRRRAVHGPVECLVSSAGMADARAFDSGRGQLCASSTPI